jgi:DNA replication and repair protein RecF
MEITQLTLVNYKNFESQSFDFPTKVNCFIGANGIGKTNTLDAIYHLCYGKGYFNPIATQNIRHGEDFFMLEGSFQKDGKTEKIVCSLKKGNKKLIKRNGKTYERLSDHIGLLPLVIISPADRDLIISGSELRRKFVDGVISQLDKVYLSTLINYNKVLAQRNSLLKYFAANHTFDADSIAVYNQQLVSYGAQIHKKRQEFLEAFIPIFQEQYRIISGDQESVSLRYQSQLEAVSFANLLEQQLTKDRALQYTSAGIHKDHLELKIGEHPIKKFGSQGQQKSFLIALKLAQYYFTKDQTQDTPILLLDDIFDKLDENRVSQLISLVDTDDFGQVFITDTHDQRTETIVSRIHRDYQIHRLGNET